MRLRKTDRLYAICMGALLVGMGLEAFSSRGLISPTAIEHWVLPGLALLGFLSVPLFVRARPENLQHTGAIIASCASGTLIESMAWDAAAPMWRTPPYAGGLVVVGAFGLMWLAKVAIGRRGPIESLDAGP